MRVRVSDMGFAPKMKPVLEKGTGFLSFATCVLSALRGQVPCTMWFLVEESVVD